MAAPTGKGKDRTPPTITITSPANASQVSGTVNITAVASDNIGVTKVDFYVDQVRIATDLIAPYTTQWTPAGDGTFTIAAIAYDKAGLTATSTVVVTKNTIIIVDPPPPTPLPLSHLIPMPPMWHQGGEGSCASMAIALARTVKQYKDTGATSYNNAVNVFSPEFLYDRCLKLGDGQYATCGSGSSFLRNYSFVYSEGICLWATLPYSSQNGCNFDTTVTAPMIAEAATFAGASYNFCSYLDRTLIKTKLANNIAVPFTCQIDWAFIQAGPGFIWNTRVGAEPGYAHALVLVGYDDSKNAYRCRNSFGDAWGDGGYIWIDYNFFEAPFGTYPYPDGSGTFGSMGSVSFFN